MSVDVMRTTNVALLLLLLLNATSSWGCFAPSDAQPSNELTELVVIPKSSEASVVYVLNGYEFYLDPQDVVSVLQRYKGLRHAHELAKILREKLPLASDVNISALLEPLAPDAERGSP